jgi:hypothetical protein
MKTRHLLNIQIAWIVTFLSLSANSFPQNPAACDLNFIDHLMNTGNFEEALFLLNSNDCRVSQSNDSVNFMKGWCLYSLKRLNASSESLVKVTTASSFYLKSHFFAAYNFAHTGSYEDSKKILDKMVLSNEKFISLRNYQLAGINLLKRNTPVFEDLLNKADRSRYEISESYDMLRKISVEMKSHKRKSPVIAGFLSVIIPGAGKFYSGKKGEAVSSFLATAGLGFVTWENYRKNGLKNFSTIAFGTAFAFSYAANIYGSVLTVRIIENEYNENVKNTILFNLHIPLRNTFDK